MEASLARAPLQIRPIKTPASVRNSIRNDLHSNDTENCMNSNNGGHFQTNLMSITNQNDKSKEILPIPITPFVNPINEIRKEKEQNLTNLSEILKNTLAATPNLSPTAGTNISKSNSTDLIFTSPLFNYTNTAASFDSNSLNESTITPDDYLNAIDFSGGLTNINYDFDLSDISGDNSTTDDTNIITKYDLEEFDPLLKKDDEEGNIGANNDNSMNKKSYNTNQKQQQQPYIENKPKSLIETDSPSDNNLLPSPIKPIVDYKGFSNIEIPTILCNTGDFNSLNHVNGNNEMEEHHDDNEEAKMQKKLDS